MLRASKGSENLDFVGYNGIEVIRRCKWPNEQLEI